MRARVSIEVGYANDVEFAEIAFGIAVVCADWACGKLFCDGQHRVCCYKHPVTFGTPWNTI